MLLMLESLASTCSSHADGRSSRVISLPINKKNESQEGEVIIKSISNWAKGEREREIIHWFT